jgi:pimeloyl-ACP methyl ester carboxylesterase
MFDSDGVQLHYVDFGGEGVPIIFVHSGDRTGYSFMEFAPRFSDRHRVLAISQRGAGLSGGDPAPGVPARILAGDVVALLDALELDRAVIAGQWANLLLHLAEEHPHRTAALVFLESHATGDYPDEDVTAKDPIGVLRMLRLNRAALWGADPDEPDAGRLDTSQYRQAGARIEVPALSFVTEAASPDDDWEQVLGLARLAESSAALFPDADVRTYFQRLAVDVDMQRQGRVFWHDVVAPAQQAREQALERAFGDRLRVVQVEPRAVGYTVAGRAPVQEAVASLERLGASFVQLPVRPRAWRASDPAWGQGQRGTPSPLPPPAAVTSAPAGRALCCG